MPLATPISSSSELEDDPELLGACGGSDGGGEIDSWLFNVIIITINNNNI